MDDAALDKLLNQISLVFGTDSLDVILPEDALVDFPMYKLSNIDRSDLEGEIVLQSKMYMLFSVLLSFVSEKFLIFEAEVKRLEASLSLEYETKLMRKDDALVKEYGERLSDKKLEKLVDNDGRMVEAINNKIKYKNMTNTFTNIVDALGKRSDMLIQLVSKRKREQEQGVT